MSVSVDVVKYADMPSKQWYVSPHHKSWYYHAPRSMPSSEASPQFLEATLDPPLRLLALGLNALGYTTLPSCSGHYKTEEEVNETYDHLVNDAKAVRKGGLDLIDVETGDVLHHRNESWYLPWDRRAFAKASMGAGGKPEGYLGFEVPKADGFKMGSALERATRENDGCRYEVKRRPNGYVFELRVYTGKQKSQDAAWQDLGDSVMLGLSK